MYLFSGFITNLSGNLYYFLTSEDSKIYQVSQYGKFKLLEGIESFDIKKIRENYEQLHFKTTLYYKRFYSYSALHSIKKLILKYAKILPVGRFLR